VIQASAPRPLSPVLVLALDGASFDVIRPMVAEGRLPHLGRWMRDGLARALPSTLPPVTFPAWSSFMTGLEPGEHGIFDFTQKLPDAYRVRFVNASERRGTSIFRRVSDAGGSVLVLGMPATHPPEALRGLLVSGFDAPVSTGTDTRSASDPELYAAIAAGAGPWMRPDLDEDAHEPGFHERAVATLLARIERKTGFALASLAALRERAGGRRPDLACVVFSESDTVGHHYWRDHDPSSPRHDPRAGPERRSAVERVYARLDEACGQLRRAFGEDALCIVVSDHGMGGASDKVVHLNRHLADCGLLVRSGGPGGLDRAARSLRDAALRLLPASLAQGLFRRLRGAAARLESSARFGGLDWRRTLAFSEEANTQPGVWINLQDREAAGCVRARDYEAVRQRVIDALLDWKLPGGGPVVARALRREEVYAGPFVRRAPDVVVELALEEGYGLSLVPTPWGAPETRAVRTLRGDELAGGRGRGMNGTHRPDGVLIASGGATELGRFAERWPASLSRVAPALAHAMGLPGAEGGAQEPGADPRPYAPEEERLVAARLRALGYLE